jgi:iron complex outermembrane receptor protein
MTTTRVSPGSWVRDGAAVFMVAASTTGAGSAYAQSQQGPVLGEVIVTSQKREQSLEEVPSAVSAISGETVRDLLGSAENIRALAGRVPGLQVESSNGRTQPRFYLRGMGNIDFDNNASQPVSMVFDEIALESNVLRSLPLFDIERVEVLKGPQGSLFGRNTNAGIIKIDSVRPSAEQEGYVSAAYGSRDTIAFEGAGGGQLGENLVARVSLKYQERGDWIDNIANGSGDDYGAFDEFAYRVQFLYDTDSFRGLLKLHGFQQDGTQPQVFYANAIEVGSAGLRPGFNEEVANQDGGASMTLDHYGAALNLQWDFGSSIFTSITGYDTVENFQSTDVDGGLLSFDPADIGALGRQVFFSIETGDGLDDHYQFTQELRLSNQVDKLFYQVGLYYFDEDIDVISTTFHADPDYSEIVSQQTTSSAIFGQVEYAVTDALSIIGGLRYTADDKDLEVIPGPGSPAPPGTISADDDYFNWDLAFTYDASDDFSWFGRLANGSRGPVTLGRFGFTSSADTETSTAAEFGFRSTLLDGRAQWNASVYAFRNDDQQLTATGGVANVNQLLNADRVNGSGAEMELDILLTENLRVTTNVSYTDTEIDDPDLRDDVCGSSPQCTWLDPFAGTRPTFFGLATEVFIDGNPLPRTPEWLFNFILQYTVPLSSGSLYMNTDWNYRSESNLFLHESVEFVAEERWLGGVRIGYRNESGSLDIAAVGRNITDEIVVDGGINFLNLTAFVNEPAYWGVEFRYGF